MPICFFHHDYGNKIIEVKQVLSRTQYANMGTNLESGPSLIRLSSIAMGHVNINDFSKENYNSLCSSSPISY